jgi:hypothetical protein
MRTLSPVLLCSLAAAQTTWIVDDSGGPGVNFTSLPAAVAAAANGDTLLVAAGTYEAFHVANKALTIVGAGAGSTDIALAAPAPTLGSAMLYVAMPPQGTTFRLSGVRVRTSPLGYDLTGIAASGDPSSGNLVLSDVSVGTGGPGEGVGLTVTGIEVHAVRCTFRGGAQNLMGMQFGKAAAHVLVGGRLVADACTFLGGSPTASSAYFYAVGGAGVMVDAGQAWLWSSILDGGNAASGQLSGTASAGPGLRATGGSVVRVHGPSPARIRGGSSANGSGNVGISSASSLVDVCGQVSVAGGSGYPSAGLSAAVAGTGVSLGLPARPTTRLIGTVLPPGDLDGNAAVTLQLQGSPNQLALLFLHESAALIPLPGLSDDPLLVPPDAFVVFAGALDANGDFVFAFTPATQAPILLDVPLHLQGCVFDAASGLWLGSNAEIRRIR